MRLSATAYLILSLVDEVGQATAYDLKVAVRSGAGHAWPLPHTQVYETCRALAARGLLDERLEEHGRRRRFFSLSSSGRAVLGPLAVDPDHGRRRNPRSRTSAALLPSAAPRSRSCSRRRSPATTCRRARAAESDPAFDWSKPRYGAHGGSDTGAAVD